MACLIVRENYFFSLMRGQRKLSIPKAQMSNYEYSGKGISDKNVELWEKTYRTVISVIKVIGYNTTLCSKCEIILATHFTNLIVFCGVKTSELFVEVEENDNHITNAFSFKSFSDVNDETWRMKYVLNKKEWLKSFLETMTGGQEVQSLGTIASDNESFVTNIFITATFPRTQEEDQ